MFGLLHNHTLVFQDSRPVGGGVTSFSFVPDKPFEWRAGQHGVLCVGGMMRKPFSLASAPEEGRVVIGTSVRSGSSFKQRLAALRPGDKVGFRGPVNQTFTLDGAAPRVVLLAQGVGITPLRAMLAHGAVAGLSLESSLIHVAHDGHAYRDETQQWATSAEYPQHAADFQAAATVAAKDHPRRHVLHRRRPTVRLLDRVPVARIRCGRRGYPYRQVPGIQASSAGNAGRRTGRHRGPRQLT
jgi:ferredoxin-NADP reductase